MTFYLFPKHVGRSSPLEEPAPCVSGRTQPWRKPRKLTMKITHVILLITTFYDYKPNKFDPTVIFYIKKQLTGRINHLSSGSKESRVWGNTQNRRRIHRIHFQQMSVCQGHDGFCLPSKVNNVWIVSAAQKNRENSQSLEDVESHRLK